MLLYVTRTKACSSKCFVTVFCSHNFLQSMLASSLTRRINILSVVSSHFVSMTKWYFWQADTYNKTQHYRLKPHRAIKCWVERPQLLYQCRTSKVSVKNRAELAATNSKVLYLENAHSSTAISFYTILVNRDIQSLSREPSSFFMETLPSTYYNIIVKILL